MTRWSRIVVLLPVLASCEGCYAAHAPPADGSVDAAPLERCELAPSIRRCRTEATADCYCGDEETCVMIEVLAVRPGPIFPEADYGEGVCVPGQPGFECEAFDACGPGEICVRALREQPDRIVDGLSCTDTGACLRAREALGLDPSAGCIYSDLTPALTGVPPTVDCAERPQQHLCGEGCPCAGGTCQLASEAHPWGVCEVVIGSVCRGSGACDGGACLQLRAPPEVAERWLGWDDATRCVPRDVCAALSALYPDAYSCLP